MNRGRAALAVAVVLSGSRTVRAEPCAPRAELGGDAAAIVQVRTELQRLGVDTGQPAPGCRAVRAQVELDREGGIAVAIVDGSRRSEGRVVTDPGVAAAWIDTWLRDDVDGLGSPATAAPRRATVAAAPTAAPGLVAPGERRDAGASPPLVERVSIGATYDRAWSPDGSSSTGGRASACIHVGPACVGVAAQYLREADRASRLTAMRRGDASVLATASLPIRVGRMSLAPELGVGLGRRATARVESCVDPAGGDPQCDPTDPTCAPRPTCVNGKIYVGDHLDVATYTPRLAGALRLAVPLFDHVWLEGLAAIALAPLGHSDAFTPSEASASGVPASELALPGEPGTAFQLSLGLRIGAP